MTFDENVMCMASYPLAVDMIWAGHKDNPRQKPSRVLSALEKVALLRHVIRRAELQMVRVRLVATRIGNNAFRVCLLKLCRLLPYFKLPNDAAQARRAQGAEHETRS